MSKFFRIIGMWLFVIIAGAIILLSFIRYDALYAKNLQVEGVVTSIEWKSKNHQLPIIVLLNESGKETVVSHSSVALNETNLKLGDKLVKNNGDEFCLVNGKRVRFSKYLGSGFRKYTKQRDE